MFIVIEGIEGSGKSTLIKFLEKKFNERTKEVLCTREPGGSKLGEKIRPLLLSLKEEKLSPKAELLLFLADRAEHVEKIIRPSLEKNTVVLCDRYIYSTMAYQGYARGLDLDFLTTCNDFATSKLVPDLVILLDLDVETGLARARGRNSAEASDEGKFEAEERDFHEKVRQGFLTMLATDKARHDKKVLILDASKKADDIQHEAWDYIESLLRAHNLTN